MWVGTMWIVFWIGFMCHLSIATYQSKLSDHFQLVDQKWLLREITAGHVDAAREELEERVKIGGQLAVLNAELPDITPLGMMREAIFPSELIALVRVARSSQEHEEHQEVAQKN